MRLKDLGSIVRVNVSRREVVAFKDQWPCSDLPDTRIAFDFERSNGDIVDIYPSSVDGQAAIALIGHAWTFVVRRQHRQQLVATGQKYNRQHYNDSDAGNTNGGQAFPWLGNQK